MNKDKVTKIKTCILFDSYSMLDQVVFEHRVLSAALVKFSESEICTVSLSLSLSLSDTGWECSLQHPGFIFRAINTLHTKLHHQSAQFQEFQRKLPYCMNNRSFDITYTNTHA